MRTAPWLTSLEHGGKPGHSHLGTQSTAPRNATAAEARSTPPLTAGGPGSSYLFQLAVDMLNDQVNSHCVPAPWSEPKAKERQPGQGQSASSAWRVFLPQTPHYVKKQTVPQTSLL